VSRFRILVFHRAEGFVHVSIPDAVSALRALGDAHDIAVDSTDDPERFTDDGLAPYAALVFVHTSGNVLPQPAARRALERYIGRGGGFLGIHAASAMPDDIRTDWPWYRDLVGAAFTGHTEARVWCDGIDHAAGPFADAPAEAELLAPGLAMISWEPAVVRVEDPTCAAARGLTDGETRTDEWYGFDENPRPHVHVVATVDESSYAPHRGAMGADHPVVWWQELAGGRSVYNSLGHAAATWRDERFLQSVLGGIELAAGR
jgi:type 1 glutamine amidotransferase